MLLSLGRALGNLAPEYTTGRPHDLFHGLARLLGAAGLVIPAFAIAEADPLRSLGVVVLTTVVGALLAVFGTSGFVLVTGLHRRNRRPWNLVMTALVVAGVAAPVVVPTLYLVVEAGVLRDELAPGP